MKDLLETHIPLNSMQLTELSEYILQVISEMQLDIKRCVSQCYDGASGMSAGVSTKILQRNIKAVYIHCCARDILCSPTPISPTPVSPTLD